MKTVIEVLRDWINKIALLVVTMGKPALPVELTKASLLPVFAKLSLVIAMDGSKLRLLLVKVFGQGVIEVSQLVSPVRKRT